MKTETEKSLKFTRDRKMVSDIAWKQLMKFKTDTHSLDGLSYFITPFTYIPFFKDFLDF